MSQYPTNLHTSVHFYDAANSRNVPSGVYAAVYINGDFVWPESERRRMSHIIGVSVEREAFWAEHGRAIDLENKAALPEDAPGFVKHRGMFLASHGFHHNDAVVYVNRANRGDVVERLQHAGITIVMDNLNVDTAREWVATLDGTDIPDAWACQSFTNGLFDRSILHGIDSFRRP